MRVRLHHEGVNILVVSFLILLAINLFVWLVLRVAPAVPITVTVLSAIIFLLIVNFFRSPKRNFTGDRKNVVVASADGTVVALEEVFEDEYLHKNVIQLSIFMTILNVHANWFPVDGEVIYTAHHNGRFLSAYLPKSSTENERSTVVIRATNGQDVLMRQVAGAIARRIVTYAQPGVEASIEDHMGFIKFGSRIDLYLPLGTEILVKIGDKTTGGITTVARLQSNDDKC
ncbi:MAG: phosphatidylserine decarboxylase family protein [Muribaculaceae bacterium]|nr:phosphatidylserine decarboxylase family protein [Muribaculaceae bacterium]MDE6353188.1 phosphatidylserine decarboxylase family protein [Muribaculaceae bacterium]MDE6642858.1 phosphatidylserine decarboxylase family protein [Muribaculaceae bacterium]